MKYRIWCTYNNGYEKGDIFMDSQGRIFDIKHGRLKQLRDDTHVVEYFTGFYDRYGVEIYENDILQVLDDSWWDDEVIWDNEKLTFILSLSQEDLYLFKDENIKVIGNTHGYN